MPRPSHAGIGACREDARTPQPRSRGPATTRRDLLQALIIAAAVVNPYVKATLKLNDLNLGLRKLLHSDPSSRTACEMAPN